MLLIIQYKCNFYILSHQEIITNFVHQTHIDWTFITFYIVIVISFMIKESHYSWRLLIRTVKGLKGKFKSLNKFGFTTLVPPLMVRIWSLSLSRRAWAKLSQLDADFKAGETFECSVVAMKGDPCHEPVTKYVQRHCWIKVNKTVYRRCMKRHKIVCRKGSIRKSLLE